MYLRWPCVKSEVYTTKIYCLQYLGPVGSYMFVGEFTYLVRIVASPILDENNLTKLMLRGYSVIHRAKKIRLIWIKIGYFIFYYMYFEMLLVHNQSLQAMCDTHNSDILTGARNR